MRVWTPRLMLFSVTLIAILLIVLGVLQYRSVGELSEFEHRRMRDSLQVASERFEDDFDRELEHLWDTFRARRDGDFPRAIATAYAEWRGTFPLPELVEAAYWVRSEETRDQLYRFSSVETAVELSAWPPVLAELQPELRRDLRLGRRQSGSYVRPLGAETLALVVAQRNVSVPSRAVVLLRRSILVEEFIPTRVRELVAGGGELDYDVWIVDEAGAPSVVYGGSLDETGVAGADIRISLRIPDDLDFLRDGREEAHLWSVLLRHRAGSLEAAIEQLRRRNLMIGAAVLALLGASVIALVVATRRAQSLAAQQVEFVAGVSHELRTPITGISSLSQNLADGVIRDLDQARTYGAAIHRESGRLAAMIESVLQFSAMRAGSQYELRPVVLSDVIDDALEAVGPSLPQQFRFEKALEEPLPAVLGDARGLSSAIQNLISNAMKFTDAGGLIRLTARVSHEGGRPEIQVSVEDRGRGIPPDERSHVFDPFYRGARARTEQVPGSGLGLSLVKHVAEAHRGRVTYLAPPAGGSAFTLHFPAALDAERQTNA